MQKSEKCHPSLFHRSWKTSFLVFLGLFGLKTAGFFFQKIWLHHTSSYTSCKKLQNFCDRISINTRDKHTAQFSTGLEPPFSEGSPFLGTPSFWSKFKKLPPSFWEPSKLVHANCMKHFKTKELHFVLC